MRRLVCPVLQCNSFFTYSGQHRGREHTYPCAVCSEGFPTLKTRQEHQDRYHLFTCLTCCQSFPTQNSHNKHECAGLAKPILCSVCNKGFSSPDAYKEVGIVYGSEKNFCLEATIAYQRDTCRLILQSMWIDLSYWTWQRPAHHSF